MKPRFIMIDGRTHQWADILQLRRDQLAACAESEQPVLFDMHEDKRPEAVRTAAGRYLEPGLFDD